MNRKYELTETYLNVEKKVIYVGRWCLFMTILSRFMPDSIVFHSAFSERAIAGFRQFSPKKQENKRKKEE